MSFGKLGQRIRGFFETLAKNFKGGALVSQVVTADSFGTPNGGVLSMASPTGVVSGAEQITGTIVSFEDSGSGMVIVTTAAPHGRGSVYTPSQQVVIAGGTPYDGPHYVYTNPPVLNMILGSHTFLINTPYTGGGSGTYAIGNMVRILASGSNRPAKRTKTEVRVVIAGTTNYNGTKAVYNPVADSFEIASAYVSSQSGTWTSSTEVQINTAGAHSIADGDVVGLNAGAYANEVFRARNPQATSFEITGGYVGTATGFWVKGSELFIDGPGGVDQIEIEEGQYCFLDIMLYAFGGTATAISVGYKGTVIYRRGWNHGVITPWGSALTSVLDEGGVFNVMSPKIDMSGSSSERLAIMVSSTVGSFNFRWIARVSGVSGIGYVGS